MSGHFLTSPAKVYRTRITLRCLEALSLLVTSNDLVPIYFLTEQEVPVALHKRSAKKSKDSGPLNEAGAAPAVSETATHRGAAQATVISEPSLSLAAANKLMRSLRRLRKFQFWRHAVLE
ncbi:hypothetical protein PCANC_21048 [Puccinia coronata f. sp. avenae]|uniref:Uncharacterized protein n=1 Tax=Puccinia coronata f. sp. avenae TaxID=200324 RepID=A0A2N5TWC1_9BASI|nr:hypothetical protein PCANC_21048 [Puccinia coronata f. sp. avenae]